MKKGKIGIFDSGYGGLTVMRSIVDVLPEYDYLYFGDNARAPYGNRSFDTVYHYTLECVNWLFDEGCDLVIAAFASLIPPDKWEPIEDEQFRVACAMWESSYRATSK